MEAQDDPFQPGGPATSSKITLGMIITQLVTGYAFMDFLSTLSWDWQLLRGKHGCRIGAFLLYFGSRYLGITSVLATVIFLDTFPVVYINPLRYIAAVTAGFALGLAFSIILLRISFMYKKTWLCIVIDVLRFLFWGVLIRGMIQTPAVLNGRGFQYAQTACVLLLATVTFFAALLRAIYVCRAEHCFGISKLAHVVVREDVCELGVIWAGALVMSVVLYMNSDPSGTAAFATLYLSFVIIIVNSNRVYRKLLARSDTCPARFCATLIFIRFLRNKLCPPSSLPSANDPTGTSCHGMRAVRWLLRPSAERPRVPVVDNGGATRRGSSVDTPSALHPATATQRVSTVSGKAAAARQHAACFANSRSTYAHTSLFDSRDS